MREVIRGYAAAVFEALGDDEVEQTRATLARFGDVLRENDDLSKTLTDDALPLPVRIGIVSDVLSSSVSAARQLVVFVVRADHPSELSNDVAWLVFRAVHEPGRRSGQGDPDSAVGHTGVNERLHGFALARFEHVADQQVVDDVEDQLFRVSRMLEAHRQLNDTLTDLDLPAELREGVVTDLLSGKAEPVTVDLVRYAVRQNRGQLVTHLDWLAERVAEERGRRNALVSTAVELSPEQADRLQQALGSITGRRVSLQVDVEPDLLGGLRVVVGDTVLDGTVRTRLQQVGRVLVHGTGQRSAAREGASGREGAAGQEGAVGGESSAGEGAGGQDARERAS